MLTEGFGRERISLEECSKWSSGAMLSVVRGNRGWFRRRFQRRVILHLLTGCPSCTSKIKTLVQPSLNLEDQWFESGLATNDRDIELYERALIRLGKMERSAQELYLNGVEGLRSRGFVEWLVAECRRVTSSDPSRALELGRLAVLASEGTGVNSRALAAMRMGQVLRRCRGDYLGAETWFDQASELLNGEGADELLMAKLFRLRAFSLYSQRRSEEALPLFDDAIRIYQVVGDVDCLGKALVEKAAALADVEGPRAAIQLAFRACGLIDFSKSPRQAAVIAQNLSLYYSDLGKVERAVAFLEIARDLIAEQGNAPADALRMDWSAGRILAEAERFTESAEVFRATKAGFVELGLAAEAGQVSLDLSLSLLNLGRMRELREVAEEMLPIFRSRLLHKEALAAVGFFREAVMSETITAAHIHAVSNFLVELESNSKARFRKPS